MVVFTALALLLIAFIACWGKRSEARLVSLKSKGGSVWRRGVAWISIRECRIQQRNLEQTLATRAGSAVTHNVSPKNGCSTKSANALGLEVSRRVSGFWGHHLTLILSR